MKLDLQGGCCKSTPSFSPCRTCKPSACGHLFYRHLKVLRFVTDYSNIHQRSSPLDITTLLSSIDRCILNHEIKSPYVSVNENCGGVERHLTWSALLELRGLEKALKTSLGKEMKQRNQRPAIVPYWKNNLNYSFFYFCLNKNRSFQKIRCSRELF